jgi:hypothetical protein
MLISYLRSRRGSASSSPRVYHCAEGWWCGTAVKRNDSGGWSFDVVVLWLERRQNRDAVECWREWPKLRWYFYSNGGWESDGLGRVVNNDDPDSMLQFWLKREGDGMKCCRKIKRKQWVRLGSMERKYDMARWHDNVSQKRCDTGEEKWRRWRQLGWRES